MRAKRFHFDEPKRASAADDLLAAAESVGIVLSRSRDGGVEVDVTVTATLGAALSDDGELPDHDADETAARHHASDRAIALVRRLLTDFSPVGKDGAA